MSDFEQLGAFYLGHRVGAEGATEDPILYDAKDLTTHAVCVGMTGSGKTGLSVVMLEEAAIDGIPVIAIDPKGDLGNLMLAFPNLSAAEFAPWVESAEDPAEVAARWKAGIERDGQDTARVARLKGAVDRAIYTPGSSAGRPLAVLGSFAPPPRAILEDADALREEVEASVSALCALIDVDPDPIASSEHILLATLLTRAWVEGRSLELGAWIREVLDPPIDRIGALPLDTFFPAADRRKLGMRLNRLLASPGFAPWLDGEPLDISRLLYTEEGKPRLSILSIAHLGDRERMFFVTLVLSRLVTWMRAQPGTSSLRAVLFMDEVFGFFPPVAEPPSKRPMLTLLKQARAHGLGVMLATQNPIDLDYRGLSNCGTWMLGRLSTERDVDRVIEGLAGAAQGEFDAAQTRRQLAGLEQRRFLMRNVHDAETVTFTTRWAMSYLRGPLTTAQISSLSPPPARPSSPSAVAPLEKTASARPVLDLPQRLLAPLPGRGALEWRQGLVADVRLHHTHRYSGLDAWQRRTVIAHGDSWDDAQLYQPERLYWTDQPPEGAWGDVPRALTAKGKWKKVEKALATYLSRSQTRQVFRAPAHKAWSNAEETRAEFAARIALVEREKRDAALQKLRKKYAPKLARLQARITRAQEKVEREKSQYSSRKMDAAVSVGSTVLGALFGRSVFGRATTAARGASRVARERDDVRRAEESLNDLRRELRELEEDAKDAIEELKSAPLDPPEIEAREVRPTKSDFGIQHLSLLWIPYRAGPDGVSKEAWRDEHGAG